MNVSNTILLSPADNVAVANGRIEIGTVLPGGALATAVIEPGHKVAIKPIAAGEAVVKYAQAIGRATPSPTPPTGPCCRNIPASTASCRSSTARAAA